MVVRSPASSAAAFNQYSSKSVKNFFKKIVLVNIILPDTTVFHIFKADSIVIGKTDFLKM